MSNREPVRTRRSGAPDQDDILAMQYAPRPRPVRPQASQPLNPWLFGAIGLGAVSVAVILMAWGIPAAIRFVAVLLATDLSL